MWSYINLVLLDTMWRSDPLQLLSKQKYFFSYFPFKGFCLPPNLIDLNPNLAAFAEYILMQASEDYMPFMNIMREKIAMSKVRNCWL